MTKTDLIFPAFSSRFVDFEVQFCFEFFSANHNSLLRIGTNEIASFCIDHRLRQMAFFRLRQSGQRRGKGWAFALC